MTGGSFPRTKADDGDPPDVLIIHDAQTYPGVVLRCKPIGVKAPAPPIWVVSHPKNEGQRRKK
jgi:hypothetical protein